MTEEEAARGIEIRSGVPEEAADIAALVRRAFVVQAELYEDFTLPPLGETEDSVLEAMRSGTVLVAADSSGAIVGTVRGEMRQDSCYVARLAVAPERRGSGIGRALVQRIESDFPLASKFEMFTGHRSAGPLHIYESLGYREVRREPVNERLSLVYLEKPAAG